MTRFAFDLYLFLFFGGGGWSRTWSTITEATTGLFYYTLLMDDECGAVGGTSGRRNRSTRIKPTLVPLCPQQIPHGLTRARTRDAAWLVSLVTFYIYFSIKRPPDSPKDSFQLQLRKVKKKSNAILVTGCGGL
jgi:hypothetical protein